MAVALVCCLAVLSTIVHQGLAIKCYVCGSQDSSCQDNPPDSLLQTCPFLMNGCSKLVIEKSIQVVNIAFTPGVTRSCAVQGKVGCFDSKVKGGTICYCTTDGCNSSIRVAASIPVGATALMLLTFVLLWF